MISGLNLITITYFQFCLNAPTCQNFSEIILFISPVSFLLPMHSLHLTWNMVAKIGTYLLIQTYAFFIQTILTNFRIYTTK